MSQPVLAPHLLDELSANATATATALVLDGWLVRSTPALPFRRSNCVVPLSETSSPSTAVDERISLVERFYRSRGLPVRFQISPSSEPADLDQRLEARGYVIDAPVDYLAASTVALMSTERPRTPVRVLISEEIDEDWIASYGNAFDDEDATSRRRMCAYGELLRDIGPSTVTALAEVDGAAVGVGFGVIERGWMGVYGMATHSAARRRGIARSVVLALVDASIDRVQHTYLQVETQNEAAQRLYRSLGFEPVHRYHFRVLDASA